MRKISKIAAIMALVAGLLPAAALAHYGNGDNNDNGGNHGNMELRGLFKLHSEISEGSEGYARKGHGFAGTVTAVGVTSFTLTTADAKVFTVNTVNAKIYHPFSDVVLLFTDIHVNDKVQVRGTLTGTTIDAKIVLDMPANTHPAKAKGKVTAISGSTLTVQTNHDGVISNVTVNTNAGTTITKVDGSSGTLADIAVGAKVQVKGLWDELLNVLNAIKIKIRA